ncbi:MAG: SUMF1/EgtB/PvdO family nonheme iron enzyme [Verrucomicrobiales bacterium]|nr:SUMF1/EgtB/PvdO family nonheme iron enzyme [Verrucomicrobiae bacterium]MCP5554314.1 SUMF1/EgtB/PvdO family nonheme iron enzyme [Akkermansiaceae bacterium]
MRITEAEFALDNPSRSGHAPHVDLVETFFEQLDTVGADVALEWLASAEVPESVRQSAKAIIGPGLPRDAAICMLRAVWYQSNAADIRISGNDNITGIDGGVAIGTINVTWVRQLVSDHGALREATLVAWLEEVERTNEVPLLGAPKAQHDNAVTLTCHRLPQLRSVYTDRRALRVTTSSASSEARSQRFRSKGEIPEWEHNSPGPLMDLLLPHRCCVVTGGPGLGKTFLVRHLALSCLALGGENGASNGGIPLMLSLRSFGPWLAGRDWYGRAGWERRLTADLVWDYLAENWATKPWEALAENLREALLQGPGVEVLQGRMLFLCDGLDEVSTGRELRTAVARVLQALARRYPRARIIVTCRSRSYEGPHPWVLRAEPRDRETHEDPWETFELLRYNPEEISRFIRDWYEEMARCGRLPAEAADQRTQVLEKTLADPSRADLGHLAEVPLILRAMCEIHGHYRELPRGRSALLSRLIDLQLGDWEERRSQNPLESQTGGPAASSFQDLMKRPGEEGANLEVTREALCRELGALLFHLTREFAEDRLGRSVEETEHEAEAPTIDLPAARLERLLAGLYLGTSLAHLPAPDDPTVPQPALDWALEMLRYIREKGGLLDSVGGIEGPLVLPHRQYGEYLAGWWLVQHGRENRKAMSGAESCELLVRDLCSGWRAWEEVWREPILYAVSHLIGLSNEPGIQHLARVLVDDRPDGCDWHHLAIAAEILAEHGNRAHYRSGGDLWGRVHQALENRLIERSLRPTERDRIGGALAALGDERPGVGVRRTRGGKASREDAEVPDILWSEPIEPPPEGFTMGATDSDPSAWDQEKPAFLCRLIPVPYRMAVFPVTVAQFRAFVRAGGYSPKGRQWWTEEGWAWREEESLSGPGCEDYPPPYRRASVPMTGVSFFEAVAFCRWLRDLGGRCGEALLSGVRLPTEMEWELAARGPDERKVGRRNPWGYQKQDLADRCNVTDSRIGHPSPVGLFGTHGRAWCGAEDMAGNVWEWTCSEWTPNYHDFRGFAAEKGGGSRVLRGGSFYVSPWSVHASIRDHDLPDVRNGDVGFRLVSSPFFPTA